MGYKKVKTILLSVLFFVIVLSVAVGWYFFYQWPYNLFQKYTSAYANDIVACHVPWQEPYLRKGFNLNAERAQKGNLNAQFNQAIAYLGGIGVETNQTMGMNLMQQTAERGLPIAEATYGYLLDPKFTGANNGYGWYHKAATQNDPFGQMYLASYYIQQINNPASQAKAFNLLTQAAKSLGMPKYYLGNAYYGGLGTAVNQGEALKWFQAAFSDPTVGVEVKVLIANQLASIYYQNASNPDAQKQVQYWSNQAIKLSKQTCQKINY